MKDQNYYIASCSCGNDSMAMVWELIHRGYPLDEVVRYNNGMDFKCIDNLWEKVKQKCEPFGIKCTELKPKNEFLYDMFERPKIKRTGELVFGDGWCGGGCRWGTFEKISVLNKYAIEQNATVYVGLAKDETKRILDLEYYKLAPLSDWEYTQTDCLEINRKNGIDWLEETDNGEMIDLYTILDRVSCWCCANKNQWELYNIWKYFPNTYWQRLKDMQSKLDMPMKKFKNKKFGEYGNIFELEKVFESGYVPKHRKGVTTMTDKKPTDNEIVKALERLIELTSKDMLISNKGVTYGDVLYLINRLQARVEKAEKVEHYADKTIATLQAENERLKKSLKVQGERLVEERRQKYEQIDIITKLKDQLLTAKAEAYKEFAERLKNEIISDTAYGCDTNQHSGYYDYQIKIGDIPEYIDNLLKELVGE